jgi:hypothetical protein
MIKMMKNNNNHLTQSLKQKLKNFAINFTLAKFGGALFTVTILAIVKYWISGNFHLEYCEFWNNIGIGLLGWTVNTAFIGWLSDYLGIKGINFNLNQFMFGFYTMNDSGVSAPEDLKAKLYNAMMSDDGLSTGTSLDKGKEIDRSDNKAEGSSKALDRETGMYNDLSEGESKQVDKGKAIERTIHPLSLKNETPTEPHLVTWSKVFPGLDPASVFFPKKINPGPGFNVPGGDVPIRDDICKHIDYNTKILSQFRRMDLETALEQRKNNLIFMRELEHKLGYARGVLEKVPTIPTTEYEFRLKNQILSDLEGLSRDKIRAEARVTLLNSRIEFIQVNIDSNK